MAGGYHAAGVEPLLTRSQRRIFLSPVQWLHLRLFPKIFIRESEVEPTRKPASALMSAFQHL